MGDYGDSGWWQDTDGRWYPPSRPRGVRRQRRSRRRIRNPLKGLRTQHVVQVVTLVVLLVVGVDVVRQQTAGSPVSSGHASAVADGPDHASAAAAGPDYSFEKVNRSGTPMRWNPCAPIHYQTNLSEAPSTAASDLAHALQAVSSATGIRFVDDGATSVIPTVAWQRVATEKRSPVVIAWASVSQTDLLADNPLIGTALTQELGTGGPGAIIDPVTGHGVYVAGLVVIDRDASAKLASGFGADGAGVVLMHELGHLIGLGHTASSADIMNPTVQPMKTGNWGPGDLAGLARLGIESGCLAVPSSQNVRFQ